MSSTHAHRPRHSDRLLGVGAQIACALRLASSAPKMLVGAGMVTLLAWVRDRLFGSKEKSLELTDSEAQPALGHGKQRFPRSLTQRITDAHILAARHEPLLAISISPTTDLGNCGALLDSDIAPTYGT